MADAGARPRLVLASSSPQRARLLARLGVTPELRPADLDETPLRLEPPDLLVRRLAAAKAHRGAMGSAAGRPIDDEVVLGADTVVVLEGRILGKPRDGAMAEQMLTDLSGRTHEVVTGIAVQRGQRTELCTVTTEVTFRSLSAAEIAWYLATDEPRGKAGAYGLQAAGAVLVERLEGSDTNVVGLPLAETVALLRTVGLDLLAAAAATGTTGTTPADPSDRARAAG